MDPKSKGKYPLTPQLPKPASFCKLKKNIHINIFIERHVQQLERVTKLLYPGKWAGSADSGNSLRSQPPDTDRND